MTRHATTRHDTHDTPRHATTRCDTPRHARHDTPRHARHATTRRRDTPRPATTRRRDTPRHAATRHDGGTRDDTPARHATTRHDTPGHATTRHSATRIGMLQHYSCTGFFNVRHAASCKDACTKYFLEFLGYISAGDGLTKKKQGRMITHQSS